MSELIPSRARPASAILLALGTIVALLVAPLCPSLCAARSCSPGTGQAQCHDMAGMGATGGEQLVAPGKTCGASHVSAMLVKADEQTLLSPGARSTTAQVSISGSSEQLLGILRASPRRGHRLPSESAQFFLLTTNLRI